MYALKQSGQWTEFTGGLLPLDGGTPYPVPGQWSDADKEARFGLFAVSEDAIPEGQQVVSETLIDDGGRPRLSRTFEDLPPVRQMVAKSVVQARIIDARKMSQAYAALTSNPIYFARWFAPDHPAVYCDDPDAVELVTALELDPAVILAPS